MKKHILVVSQYFHPEPFRINDICKDLVKRGYKVTVLTGIPNYPEGKFYPGYSWFKRRKETWEGIDIIRIPLLPRGKTSVGMVLNYFSFVVSGFFWKLFTRLKADVIFSFETSPMTQVLISVWYAKRRKLRHILYVQDIWPERVVMATGIKTELIIGPLRKMSTYIYRNTDKILTTSPSFREDIRSYIPDTPEKVDYWPQYAEEFYRPLPRAATPEIPDNGKFKVIFTGNIGQTLGLDVLVRTATLLKDQPVEFVIVGDGRYREQMERYIQELDVQESFRMIPRQPAERIPELLAACDAAFASFMDNKTISAKLQSYLACGMPVIAADDGETRRIVQEAICGLCCAFGDEKGLAEIICQMMSHPELPEMKKRARAYFEANFEKTMLMDELEVLLKRMIKEEEQ